MTEFEELLLPFEVREFPRRIRQDCIETLAGERNLRDLVQLSRIHCRVVVESEDPERRLSAGSVKRVPDHLRGYPFFNVAFESKRLPELKTQLPGFSSILSGLILRR